MIVIEKGILEKVEEQQTNKGTKYLKVIINAGKHENAKFDNRYDVEVFGEYLMNQVRTISLGNAVIVTGRPNISAYISSTTNNPTYKLRINASGIELINSHDKVSNDTDSSITNNDDLMAEFM